MFDEGVMLAIGEGSEMWAVSLGYVEKNHISSSYIAAMLSMKAL